MSPPAPGPLAWFDELGTGVQAAWDAVGQDHAAFPDIAAAALADRPPAHATSFEELSGEILAGAQALLR